MSLIALLAVSGCTIVDDEMLVQVSFGTVNTGCAAAGVATVDYELYDAGGLVESRAGLGCGDILFTNLFADTYDIYVTGFDANGVAAYEGLCTGLYHDGVDTIHSCTFPSNLEDLYVDVDWDLSSVAGTFVPGTCADAGVFDYTYRLLSGGVEVVGTESTGLCSASGTAQLTILFEDLLPGTYTFQIEGYEEANPNDFFWTGDCLVSTGTTNPVCNAVDDGG